MLGARHANHLEYAVHVTEEVDSRLAGENEGSVMAQNLQFRARHMMQEVLHKLLGRYHDRAAGCPLQLSKSFGRSFLSLSDRRSSHAKHMRTSFALVDAFANQRHGIFLASVVHLVHDQTVQRAHWDQRVLQRTTKNLGSH